mmetsp:Transcript_54403/g.119099  ORF Transcript_54403/g.119099 Transcript_54403/m.119099 type:complete len:102 (-) Transcript_54403:50-355(-)
MCRLCRRASVRKNQKERYQTNFQSGRAMASASCLKHVANLAASHSTNQRGASSVAAFFGVFRIKAYAVGDVIAPSVVRAAPHQWVGSAEELCDCDFLEIQR